MSRVFRRWVDHEALLSFYSQLTHITAEATSYGLKTHVRDPVQPGCFEGILPSPPVTSPPMGSLYESFNDHSVWSYPRPGRAVILGAVQTRHLRERRIYLGSTVWITSYEHTRQTNGRAIDHVESRRRRT